MTTTTLTNARPCRGSFPTLTPARASVLPVVPVRDLYLPTFAAGDLDPDPAVLGRVDRPLVFYALDAPETLRLTKNGAGLIRIDF